MLFLVSLMHKSAGAKASAANPVLPGSLLTHARRVGKSDMLYVSSRAILSVSKKSPDFVMSPAVDIRLSR